MVLLGTSKSKTRTGLPTQTKVVAPLPIDLPSTTKPEKEVPIVSNTSTPAVWGSKSESPLSTSPIPDSISTSPPIHQQNSTPWQSNKNSQLKQDTSSSRQESSSRSGREDDFPTLRNTGSNGSAAPRYLDEKSNYGPPRSSHGKRIFFV